MSENKTYFYTLEYYIGAEQQVQGPGDVIYDDLQTITDIAIGDAIGEISRNYPDCLSVTVKIHENGGMERLSDDPVKEEACSETIKRFDVQVFIT